MCRFFRKKPDPQTPTPTGTISLHVMSSILLDKLEQMGCSAPIYLPDEACKVYDMGQVVKALRLSEVSALAYIPEEHDCDDFAAKLYGEFAGLCWTNTHALNWFVDEANEFWFIEPQTNKISDTLENWQGWYLQFLLGR